MVNVICPNCKGRFPITRGRVKSKRFKVICPYCRKMNWGRDYIKVRK